MNSGVTAKVSYLSSPGLSVRGPSQGSGPGCLASSCVRVLATCFFSMVIFEVEALEIKNLVSGS